MKDRRLTPVLNALDDLERAVQDAQLRAVEELPFDIRWRLHVLATSTRDYTFWVREDGFGAWTATEVETGVSGAARKTPEDALAAYWKREYS